MSYCSTRSSKTLIVDASPGQAILRSGMWLVFKEWTVLWGSLHTFNMNGQTQHQLVNNSQMNFSKAPLQNRTRSIAINEMSYLSSSTTTSVSEHACALKNTYEITLERSRRQHVQHASDLRPPPWKIPLAVQQRSEVDRNSHPVSLRPVKNKANCCVWTIVFPVYWTNCRMDTTY